MVRRSFRLGLRLGLLLGITFALVKTVQARRSRDADAPEPWTPLVDDAPPPARPASPRPVDEVGEPIEVPPPAEEMRAAPEVDVPAAAPSEPLAGTDPNAGSPPPAPLKKKAPATRSGVKKAAARPRGWVEPSAGACPSTHPIKAKLTSRIFHLPGNFAYDRTRADRCYANERTALKDGFVKAKR